MGIVRAVIFADTRSVRVEEVPDADLEEPTDVVVRISSSAICGTDLHMYDGRTGATPGLVLGHEPLGVIDQAGSGVEMVKPGCDPDPPVLRAVRQLRAGILGRMPAGTSRRVRRRHGDAGMGPYRGAHAELLRVPYADANCTLVPGEPGDDLEDDSPPIAPC